MTATSESISAQIEEKAIKAKTAATSLRLATEKEKNEALAALADHLKQNMSYILTENAKDIEAGRKKGYDAAYIDRLIRAGLDGIEACYPYSKTSYGGTLTPEQIEREVRERYAGRVSIISGGSDYHADFKKGVKKEKARNIGECGITLEYFEHNRLLQAILGKNRPSLFV